MTASKDPREQLNSFTQSLIDDLFNTPDAEILNEALEDKSFAEAGANARSSYANAIRMVGAQRLEIARAEMQKVNHESKANITNIDSARALRIIAKLSAANDPNLTLAARNLDNITGTEAIELVKELMELGAIKDNEL